MVFSVTALGSSGLATRSGAVVEEQPSAVGFPVASPVLSSPARPTPNTSRVTATTRIHRKRCTTTIMGQEGCLWASPYWSATFTSQVPRGRLGMTAPCTGMMMHLPNGGSAVEGAREIQAEVGQRLVHGVAHVHMPAAAKYMDTTKIPMTPTRRWAHRLEVCHPQQRPRQRLATLWRAESARDTTVRTAT